VIEEKIFEFFIKEKRKKVVCNRKNKKTNTKKVECVAKHTRGF
jgi:hypothetical protein